MNTVDLLQLDGRSVLVRSTRDHRNPPTALRGTIEVRPAAKIGIEYPIMFNADAQHRVISLNEHDVERLLASERDGVYEFTVDDSLEPAPTPRSALPVSPANPAKF